MSKRVTNRLFARLLALSSMLLLIPPFLYACAWFAHVSLFAAVPLLRAPYEFPALILLALSLTIEQEPGNRALSPRWTRLSLITAALLLFPVALGLGIHVLVGT